MVVDSYPDSAESFARLITMWGYEARACFNADEALSTAEDFRPDAVLMEVRVDGMDGFELARRLRTLPRAPAPTLIAVTGRTDTACRRRCQDGVFDHFLPKPVEPETLEELLRHLSKAGPQAHDGPPDAVPGPDPRLMSAEGPALWAWGGCGPLATDGSPET
jgi:CheY-like chemotaxis protein